MHAFLPLGKSIPHDRYLDFEANIAYFIFSFFNNLIIKTWNMQYFLSLTISLLQKQKNNLIIIF